VAGGQGGKGRPLPPSSHLPPSSRPPHLSSETTAAGGANGEEGAADMSAVATARPWVGQQGQQGQVTIGRPWQKLEQQQGHGQQQGQVKAQRAAAIGRGGAAAGGKKLPGGKKRRREPSGSRGTAHAAVRNTACLWAVQPPVPPSVPPPPSAHVEVMDLTVE
jgi:hypothetical protein